MLISLALMAGAQGCNPDLPRENAPPPPPETEDPNYKEAEASRRAHPHKALQLYLKVIRERARFNGRDGLAPESHRGAGEIYLSLKNGVYAAYHFNEYKSSTPTAAGQTVANSYLARTRPLLASGGFQGTTHSSDDYTRLVDRCRDLEKVGTELRAQIRALHAELAQERAARHAPAPRGNVSPARQIPAEAFIPAVPAPPPPRPATPPPPTQYTVTKRDTLFGISAKVYGNGAHYKKIYDANRDKLRSPNSPLQEGWILRIPPL